MKNISIFIKSMEQTLIKQFFNPKINFNKLDSCILLSIFLILFGTQCKKESNEIINSYHQLTPRVNTNCWNNTESNSTISGTYQPGTYTVINNCIRFTNHEEFKKTELFLIHATTSEVESWYNSLPILTSEKAYQDFMDQYNCNDNITISEITSLLSTHGNTIRYN